MYLENQFEGLPKRNNLSYFLKGTYHEKIESSNSLINVLITNKNKNEEGKNVSIYFGHKNQSKVLVMQSFVLKLFRNYCL